MVGEVGHRELGAIGEHDDRDRLLAPALVAHADHRDFAHLRQLVDHALDLGGGDVLAAGDDHVLLAVGQVQEAVLVEIADVAGTEPVAEEGGRGFFRILPVALRDFRPAQADLAILAGGKAVAGIVADFDLDMGNGAAGRADFFDLAARLHKGVAAAGFGQAIGIDVARVLEEVREGADAHLRRLLAAADRPFQAGDIVAVAGGAGEDRRRHDRREPGGVELFRFDRVQRLLGLEIAVNRQHAAMPEHGDAGQIERADMVERADHQQARFGVQAQRQRLVGRLPVEILVSEHHALGAIGGARGVHQPHQVARLRGASAPARHLAQDA